MPYEIDLQKNEFIQTLSNTLNLSVIELSSLIVKGLYSILFILVLLIIFFLLQKAIKSPWGRMMRAVRDNEISAEAMGINVKKDICKFLLSVRQLLVYLELCLLLLMDNSRHHHTNL